MVFPVLSTYRLQMRGASSGFGFTFADAEKLLDYLDELGVSHLYLSPILTPVAGSAHGYDVADPTTVSRELGGPGGLAKLSAAARARGLGLIVDIVPNHVGIDQPEQNPWWWDVLQHGRDSEYASFFDIDWDLGEGRILLPVLGSDGDAADLTVDGDLLRLGDLAVPIAPGTGDGSGPDVHDRQHYRLIGWRNGVCGYRRFFSITSLAGLRQEDRAVFDASHVEVRRWFAEGLVDGVRIDHPDGLADPAGYLDWLRELAGPDAWIVIEKILAADEPLDLSLPVAGTTGYDALREIGGVFVDPHGAQALTALADSAEIPLSAAELKRSSATKTLASELNRLRRCIVATAGADHPLLPDAVAELLTHVDVYRSDYRSLGAVLPTALAATHSGAPEFDLPLQLIAAAVGAGGDDAERSDEEERRHISRGDDAERSDEEERRHISRGDDAERSDEQERRHISRGEAAVRLEQLCGAVTAKAVEDCLFYRDARLVSLNEVGGEPQDFGVGLAEFHARASTRARLWPQAMTTLSTHDTKRGEDVRARIGVLSQVPSLWSEFVGRWGVSTPAPDPATGLFLLQNIFGVWPADGTVTGELRDRLHGYAEKAIREAAVHTTWNEPDADFEGAVHRWLDAIFDGPVARELTSLVQRLQLHAESDALGQKLLSLTSPGVPDIYQGTELWDDSLVDPDNRRAVDYDARRTALKSLQHAKMRVVAAALRVRRARPDAFLRGGHHPVLATGTGATHVVAFRRNDDVLVAVTRWTVHLEQTGWGDTVLTLPNGSWRSALTDAEISGIVPAAELFAELPVALLERSGA